MRARFARSWSKASRANIAGSVGFLLALSAAQSSSARGKPEQRRGRTPDVYRLCPGEISNIQTVNDCRRQQKTSLSEACIAVFEQ